MTRGLVRSQQSGQLHFVTFSCHARQPHLSTAAARQIFERSLEKMRIRYQFVVAGYVVMPEHVHFLVSEPKRALLAKAIQALKLSVAVQRSERPFWQPRYYDFNVYSEGKRVQKLRYMHRNPVKRGLIGSPSEWPWSSFNHWATGEIGTVEIESQWTATRGEAELARAHVPNAGHGVPALVVQRKAEQAWATRPKSGTAFTSALCSPLTAGFTITESYTYSPSGEQIERFSNGAWENDNVFASGRMIASYYGTNATYAILGQYYPMTDWLGTVRAQVTYDGNPSNLVQYTSLPFGNGKNTIGSAPDSTGLHFTGKQLDLESGNEYFGARYYGSNMGRWMSPDWADKPEAVPYSDLANPQSLNLYGYVNNNPLSKVDPDGHCCEDALPALQQFEGEFPVAPVVIGVSAITAAVGIWNNRGAIADAALDVAARGTMMGQYGDMTKQAPIANANAAPAPAAGDKANSGPKAETAPGVTAGGQATDKYGNKIGPSGKPQVNEVDHSGKKGAKDAARNEGKGAPEQHASPKKGDPHFHPTDENGNKQPTSTHHNYPE